MQGHLAMPPARPAKHVSACTSQRIEVGSGRLRSTDQHRRIYDDSHQRCTLPGARQCRGAALACQLQSCSTHRWGNCRRRGRSDGRHGCLAPRPHNPRVWPTRRPKGWTVRHHFDGHAAEGTTPASRLCRRPFPELCATVCAPIEALPQPRRRKHQVALSP